MEWFRLLFYLCIHSPKPCDKTAEIPRSTALLGPCVSSAYGEYACVAAFPAPCSSNFSTVSITVFTRDQLQLCTSHLIPKPLTFRSACISSNSKTSTKIFMKTRGLTIIGLILTGLGLIALITLLILGVTDTRRRSRDVSRLSDIRQVEADLTIYRGNYASYPGKIEDLYPEGATGYEYESSPEGCSADKERLCTGYSMLFQLEGRVGTLSGGSCLASQDGITCAR